MAITFGSLLALAKPKNPQFPGFRGIVFDGKSAFAVAPMEWVAGVPCPQPHITKPVAVPVDAIVAHLAKSRHLVVMPDHLSNGQGLVTQFNAGKVDYGCCLDLLPPMPETDAVAFDLELDALDRVLIAAGEHDIRYYLNGVLFDLSNGVLCGTNGHRLHVYRNRVPQVYPIRLDDGSCRAGGDVAVILQRDPLKWMLHSAGQFAKVTIFNPLCEKVGDLPALPGVLLQADDGFVWIRKPIEGKYPDYTRVMPAALTRPVWASLDPAQFANVLGAMGKVAKIKDAKFPAVLIDFLAGKVTVDIDQDQTMPFAVTLHSDDAGIDLPGLSAALWMGVEPGYVQDLADCVTRAAQWRLDHLNMPNQALLVTDGDFSGVVMPMRVGGPVKPEPVAVPEPEPVPDEAEDMAAEPCPAAVAALAAQLVGNAQDAAKKSPSKGRKVAKPEPVEA